MRPGLRLFQKVSTRSCYNGVEMDDMDELSAPITAPTVAAARPRHQPSGIHDHKSVKINHVQVMEPGYMARVLKKMRAESGLSLRAISERMGITRNSLSQYFWQRRGDQGSSRLEWFLRYAAACGCRVWLTYPSRAEQEELRSAYFKPPGNPAWRKTTTDEVKGA